MRNEATTTLKNFGPAHAVSCMKKLEDWKKILEHLNNNSDSIPKGQKARQVELKKNSSLFLSL